MLKPQGSPGEIKKAMSTTAARLCGHYVDAFFNDVMKYWIVKQLRKISAEHGIETVRENYDKHYLKNEGLMDIEGNVSIDELFKKIPELYR